MRVLLLFFTQAEPGAPGYLSRRGESGAANLADTLGAFLAESLGVRLDLNFEARAQSLNEDLRWKAYRKQDTLGSAVTAALGLFEDALLMCGGSAATLKTAEAIATQFGLPVCVDERLDRAEDDIPKKGVLADGLTTLLDENLPEREKAPRAVLVGTSQKALLAWLSAHMDTEKLESMRAALSDVSQEEVLPAVFACGVERSHAGVTWYFD